MSRRKVAADLLLQHGYDDIAADLVADVPPLVEVLVELIVQGSWSMDHGPSLSAASNLVAVLYGEGREALANHLHLMQRGDYDWGPVLGALVCEEATRANQVRLAELFVGKELASKEEP